MLGQRESAENQSIKEIEAVQNTNYSKLHYLFQLIYIEISASSATNPITLFLLGL